MSEHRGSYKREEATYRRKRIDQSYVRSNIGLGDHPVVSKLLSLPGVPRSGRLLELGSGDGNGTAHLATFDYEVVGVEVCETAVEMAGEHLEGLAVENAQVLCADATNLDGLDDNSFDVAVDSGCLHCIVDAEDRVQTFASVARVLREGGSFVGVTQAQPIVKSLDSNRHRICDEIVHTYLEHASPSWGPSRIVRSKEAFLTELKEAGFIVAWHEHRLFNKDWFCHHLHYHANLPSSTDVG